MLHNTWIDVEYRLDISRANNETMLRYMKHVCKVICPKAGLSLDMYYQGSAYLSLLDKGKERGSMSSPFLTEPVALC